MASKKQCEYLPAMKQAARNHIHANAFINICNNASSMAFNDLYGVCLLLLLAMFITFLVRKTTFKKISFVWKWAACSIFGRFHSSALPLPGHFSILKANLTAGMSSCLTEIRGNVPNLERLVWGGEGRGNKPLILSLHFHKASFVFRFTLHHYSHSRIKGFLRSSHLMFNFSLNVTR